MAWLYKGLYTVVQLTMSDRKAKPAAHVKERAEQNSSRGSQLSFFTCAANFG